MIERRVTPERRADYLSVYDSGEGDTRFVVMAKWQYLGTETIARFSDPLDAVEFAYMKQRTYDVRVVLHASIMTEESV